MTPASDDLFAAFGVDTGPTNRSPAATLVAMRQAEMQVEAHIPENFKDQLSRTYIAQLARHLARKREFVFLCARCSKPIHNPRQQYFDREGGAIYGTDCWGKIEARQVSLKTHYLADGARRYATPDELTTYMDLTRQQPFEALPENVQHCGTSPRMCAACPGTSVRNKGRLCDFERAREQRKQG